MESQFFICRVCGNQAELIKASGVPVHCCGRPMERLVPNSTGASEEKHVPFVRRDGDVLSVSVGSAAHPMAPEHRIEWVFLETEHGWERRFLKPGDEPSVRFAIGPDRPVAVWAYCNVHGLWKKDL